MRGVRAPCATQENSRDYPGSAGTHGKCPISVNYLFRRHAVFHFKHLILSLVNSHRFQKPLPDQAGGRAQASHVLPTKPGLTTRLQPGAARAAHAAAGWCCCLQLPAPEGEGRQGQRSPNARMRGGRCGLCRLRAPCPSLQRCSGGSG